MFLNYVPKLRIFLFIQIQSSKLFTKILNEYFDFHTFSFIVERIQNFKKGMIIR